MSTNFFQPALSSGELSTQLFGRVDLERYHSGVALMRNFYVDYRGGASTRMGTEYINETGNMDFPGRLIKFRFNDDQNYVLEFGEGYIRVLRDGGMVIANSMVITNITQGNPAIVTSSHNQTIGGDNVYISGVAGMTQVNGRVFQVEPIDVNTFYLKTTSGANVDSTAYTAYTSGGIGERYVRIGAPYLAEDLPLLKYTQSGDIMTLTHPDYLPYDLKRYAEDDWRLELIVIGTDIDPPTGVTGTKSGNGKTAYSYVVTAISESGQESIASSSALVTQAGNWAANQGHNAINWEPVVGATRYRVYKADPVSGKDVDIPLGSLHGYMGETTGTELDDTNILPDFERTPPEHDNPFEDGNNPACAAYFQQRKVYAGGNDLPETFWMSVTGAFDNFDASIPSKDDDAIEGTLASREINAIKQMVPMPGGLIMFTSGSAFQVSAGQQNDAVTPSALVATPQGYNGAADIEPIPIDYNILYVQSRGSIVRALSYNFYTNIYSGVDLSIFSNHFFVDYQILDWTYAEEPHKIVWAIRSDGRLLSLTYLAEQKISGWALHSTKGLYESCCAIQEDEQNVTYFIVKRYIDGRWVRYIERMAERLFPYGSEDAWCVDAGLERVLTTPDATVTASASTGTVTFTADSAVFTAGDVDKVLRMGGGIATITGFTSSTVLTGTFTRDMTHVIPEDPANTPIESESGTWTLDAKVSSVSGADHLEGETVSALIDGNTAMGLEVIDGEVALPFEGTKVIIGLPYKCQLQSLPLDTGEPAIGGKRKRINALTIRASESRGLQVGMDFDNMVQFKERNFQALGQPIELINGDMRIVMNPNWTVTGQYCVEQAYPLPATVLAFIPEITVGDTK